MKQLLANRIDTIILLILTVFAIATRSYGLADWSLEADEYFTFQFAQDRYKGLVNPAYYALVTGLYNFFGQSELTARLPAFFLGVISIPLFFLFAKNTIGRNAALFAAILILFSSWHLFYSQAARFYSGVFLFGSAAYFLFYHALKSDNYQDLALSIVAGLLATSFHATSIVIFGSCALFALITVFWKREDFKNFSRKIAIVYLSICVISLLAISPVLFGFIDGWHSSGQTWGHSPFSFIMQLIKYTQIPIVITATLGVFILFNQNRALGIFFCIILFLPLMLLSIGANFFSVRPDYLFHALPISFALCGITIERIHRALPGYRIHSYALIIVITFALMPEFVSHFTDKKSLDVRDVVAKLQDVRSADDRVYTAIGGIDRYSANTHPIGKITNIEPFIGNVYNNNMDWASSLKKYEHTEECIWFVMPVGRNNLANKLQQWLAKHTKLVWRKYSTRYDYSFRGYEIFVTDNCKSRLYAN